MGQGDTTEDQAGDRALKNVVRKRSEVFCSSVRKVLETRTSFPENCELVKVPKT